MCRCVFVCYGGYNRPEYTVLVVYMKRFLLTLCFDGTNYHGWQVQPNGITVQQVLQEALYTITGPTTCNVTGCSRTDSGVHARMFCCHFDADTAILPHKLADALNARLPKDIAVTDCREVAGDFHARYAVWSKEYVYQIYNQPRRNPFYEKYALHIKQPINIERLQEACNAFVGTHDFIGFSSSGRTVVDTVRTVYNCGIVQEGDLLRFYISANGFLYNMVRIIVGTLLYVHEDKILPSDIPQIILSKDRTRAGATAPPQGLFLNKVIYKEGEQDCPTTKNER